MPSIIPSYIYTLFASIIVGALIIASCGLVVANVRAEAESQQLSNIAEYVATKSMALLANNAPDLLDLKTTLDVPPLIGNQRYWIRIQNDSSGAWVEAGFGDAALSSSQKANIPCDVAASGVYISGSQPAQLDYLSNQTGVYLTLFGGS